MPSSSVSHGTVTPRTRVPTPASAVSPVSTPLRVTPSSSTIVATVNGVSGRGWWWRWTVATAWIMPVAASSVRASRSTVAPHASQP